LSKNAANINPTVSIITPSFNQARFLESAVCSVLEQDYPVLEYIVVDGGSTDGSIEIIKDYSKRLAWWVSEPDKGQTDAINKGFARATGEIYAWLNSDDTYDPDVGLVYGDANFINANGQVIGKFNAQQTSLERLKRGGVYIPQQSAFWRASLWRQVGPLDPSFYFAMDYDLWVRLARVSEIRYTPKLWANFRLHGDAKTIANDQLCWPEMLRVHHRDGGGYLAWIYARYILRKILSPWINWRRKRMFAQSSINKT
jgi:glycosyltransferase involved in cell wall biosynthesis